MYDVLSCVQGFVPWALTDDVYADEKGIATVKLPEGQTLYFVSTAPAKYVKVLTNQGSDVYVIVVKKIDKDNLEVHLPFCRETVQFQYNDYLHYYIRIRKGTWDVEGFDIFDDELFSPMDIIKCNGPVYELTDSRSQSNIIQTISCEEIYAYTRSGKHTRETLLENEIRPSDSVSNTGTSTLSTMTTTKDTLWDIFSKSRHSKDQYNAQVFSIHGTNEKENSVTVKRNSSGKCPDCETNHEANTLAKIFVADNIVFMRCKISQKKESLRIGKLANALEAVQLLDFLRNSFPKVRYNLFSNEIENEGKPMEELDLLYLTLAANGFKVKKELTIDCMRCIAKERSYHPIKEYLENASRTSPVISIDDLATRYLIDPSKYSHEMVQLYNTALKKTLIGAVKRIYEPGCKHDTACVMFGKQGERKSTFWSILGRKWFSASLNDISNKDSLMVLHRYWIHEWAEIENITSKRDVSDVKAFLSLNTDSFRIPYGRTITEYPRQSIIVGTTNRREILHDDTGDRRFWIIPVDKKIDTDKLGIEVDAIWGAVVLAYKQGEKNYMTSDAMEKLNERNNTAFKFELPWQSSIMNYIQADKMYKTDEILSEAIGKKVDKHCRADQMQVASIMRSLGWEQRIVREGSSTARKWVHK